MTAINMFRARHAGYSGDPSWNRGVTINNTIAAKPDNIINTPRPFVRNAITIQPLSRRPDVGTESNSLRSPILDAYQRLDSSE